MHRYLVDTNIVSELSRPKPNPAVEAWLAGLDVILISSISVMEIEMGIRMCISEPRARYLRAWFDLMMESAIEVVPFTAQDGAEAGRLKADLQARGRSVEWRDLMIAATATTRGWVIATQNGRHFMSAGAPIFDPFEH